jgi:hypothetical protein
MLIWLSTGQGQFPFVQECGEPKTVKEVWTDDKIVNMPHL